jgi:hypothetical protein
MGGGQATLLCHSTPPTDRWCGLWACCHLTARVRRCMPCCLASTTSHAVVLRVVRVQAAQAAVHGQHLPRDEVILGPVNGRACVCVCVWRQARARGVVELRSHGCLVVVMRWASKQHPPPHTHTRACAHPHPHAATHRRKNSSAAATCSGCASSLSGCISCEAAATRLLSVKRLARGRMHGCVGACVAGTPRVSAEQQRRAAHTGCAHCLPSVFGGHRRGQCATHTRAQCTHAHVHSQPQARRTSSGACA